MLHRLQWAALSFVPQTTIALCVGLLTALPLRGEEKKEPALKGGGLKTQEVQAVVRANLNMIRHCYEEALQLEPDLEGRIKVKFVITASGRIGEISAPQNAMENADMTFCIFLKMLRWKFSPPRNGQNVTVMYPFVFHPL
jgi:outer membrane biosynthesis protein TonB